MQLILKLRYELEDIQLRGFSRFAACVFFGDSGFPHEAVNAVE
jgi:hypothetical protein